MTETLRAKIAKKIAFDEELRGLLNKYSLENDSNTPDFILATYITQCLDAYNKAVQDRARWYGRMDSVANTPEETQR